MNVNGTTGTANKELRGVLRYMAGRQPEEEYAKKLDHAVKAVKVNEKWRREYMTLEMKINYEKEIAVLANVVSIVRNGMDKGQDVFLMQVINIGEKHLTR